MPMAIAVKTRHELMPPNMRIANNRQKLLEKNSQVAALAIVLRRVDAMLCCMKVEEIPTIQAIDNSVMGDVSQVMVNLVPR